jgi:glutamine phosphoribosylpyrophosphate amidotransferase
MIDFVKKIILGFGIIGFRDPNGIRPIYYGKEKVRKKLIIFFVRNCSIRCIRVY